MSILVSQFQPLTANKVGIPDGHTPSIPAALPWDNRLSQAWPPGFHTHIPARSLYPVLISSWLTDGRADIILARRLSVVHGTRGAARDWATNTYPTLYQGGSSLPRLARVCKLLRPPVPASHMKSV